MKKMNEQYQMPWRVPVMFLPWQWFGNRGRLEELFGSDEDESEEEESESSEPTPTPAAPKYTPGPVPGPTPGPGPAQTPTPLMGSSVRSGMAGLDPSVFGLGDPMRDKFPGFQNPLEKGGAPGYCVGFAYYYPTIEPLNPDKPNLPGRGRIG